MKIKYTNSQLFKRMTNQQSDSHISLSNFIWGREKKVIKF